MEQKAPTNYLSAEAKASMKMVDVITHIEPIVRPMSEK